MTTQNEGQTVKERNLDRATHLAANGRIEAEEIVATAEKFDEYLTSGD